MGIPYAEVIGDPVAHSKSPVIHKYWLEQLGIDGDYRATRVHEADLPAFLAGRRSDPDWRGCNVTIPHKQTVLASIDQLSPEARETGAINVVTPSAAGLAGENSDVLALREEIASTAESAVLFDMAVVVIGGGGAARAVLQVLRAVAGVETVIMNRDVAKARALLAEFGLRGRAVALDSPPPPAWLVVNASSLGMAGSPELELDLGQMGKPMVVDLVYSPVETKLLREARARGMSTTDGLSILIGQARTAFKRFFRIDPPIGTEPRLRELLTR